jgi:hypothetical protein
MCTAGSKCPVVAKLGCGGLSGWFNILDVKDIAGIILGIVSCGSEGWWSRPEHIALCLGSCTRPAHGTASNKAVCGTV